MEDSSAINENMAVGAPMPAFNVAQCHALLVGVGADLPFTVHDAIRLEQALIEHCGYLPRNVRVLTGRGATRQKIMDELDELSALVSPESTVIVFFSGHGYKLAPASGSGIVHYILPYGYDLSDRRRAQTCISRKDLLDSLLGLPCQNLALLLNCCHAGSIARLGQGIESQVDHEYVNSVLRNKKILEKGTNYHYLSATKGSQLAYDAKIRGSWRSFWRRLVAERPEGQSSYRRELKGNCLSAFTVALLEAFNGAAGEPPADLKIGDIAAYVCRRVPDLVKGRTPAQEPQLTYKGDNFAVAPYNPAATNPFIGRCRSWVGQSIIIEPWPGFLLWWWKWWRIFLVVLVCLILLGLLLRPATTLVARLSLHIASPVYLVSDEVPSHAIGPMITVRGTVLSRRGELPRDLRLFAYVRNSNGPWRLAGTSEYTLTTEAWEITDIALRVPGDKQASAEVVVIANANRPADPIDPDKYVHAPRKKVSFPAPQINVTQICDHDLAESQAPLAGCPSLSARGMASGLLWDDELVCVRITANGTLLPDTVASIPNANGDPRGWVLHRDVEVKQGDITAVPSIVNAGQRKVGCEFESGSSFDSGTIVIAHK